MRRDPKAFRERFAAWKKGKDVYKDGRPTDLYLDTMEDVARKNAENWGVSEDEALLHAMNDNSYNYQGYYDKYPESAADSRSHWTDEFKTVYHPTFSNESRYHGKQSKYNPYGLRGGMWIGDKYIPAPWQSKSKAFRLNKLGYAKGKDAEYWDAVKDFVSQHEGFKDTTYLDGKGIPTIGYGFTDPALTKRGKISRAEADKYLINRLRKEDLALRDSLSNWDLLGTDAKKALISYRYNYPAGFKDTTNFMKYWNAGDYMNAIKEVDAGWNDTANPGLRMRREAEQALLRADPFLSGNTNVNIPVEMSADPVFNKPEPSLDFTAPRLSTDVNQPFRTVSADKKIDDSAGWKAISHLLTLDILKKLAEGYNWKLPKLPPLFPLNVNQWTNSLIGYEGGKDGEEVYHPYNDPDKGYKYAPNTEFSDFIKYKLPVLNYILRYINSKSFADKYQSHFNRPLRFPIDIDNVDVNYISDSSLDAMNLGRNGYYKSPNEIWIGTNWVDDEYGRVIAHEVGHAIDDHIVYPNDNAMVGDDATYSDTYKIFHKNKQIEKDLKALKEAYRERPDWFITPMNEALKYSKRFPNSLSHDAQPRESYGDLMELRWELYNNGIYDSTSNIPAKMEHIKKYKDSIKHKNRLFKYYSDEDILDMLNTVAQNATNNHDELLYAKRGKDSLPGYATGEDGGFFNWLKNAIIGASVADAPAVATASGWHNEDGQWRLNRTAADEQLGENMSVLSTFSPTHPATAAIDWGIKKVAPLLRLPASRFVADAVDQSKDYTYTGNSESSKEFYKKVFGNGPLSYITGWTKTPPAGIEPSKTIRIPSWAILSIENSTIPRMIQMRPELPPNQLRNWIRNNIGETYTEFSDAAYRAAKKGDLAGLYESSKDFVSIRQGYEDFALLHELRHKLDHAIPLTPEEVKILKQAFNDDFLNLKNTIDKYKDMDLSKEMVTSIGDMRRALLGDQVDWSVPVAKQNELIDAARDVDIMDALMNANGYTSNYYKALIDKYGQIPSEMFGFFRNAMKKIGMFGGAIGAKKLDNNYKHGKDSGIYIKPENRGKFTALKKRTGKSASWFKAHGTPALKKMATFALNARKWKH